MVMHPPIVTKLYVRTEYDIFRAAVSDDNGGAREACVARPIGSDL